MKKIVFSGFVAFCLMLISCQSEKTKVCKIVDDFLKYNDTLSLSEEYKEAYKSCEKIAYLDDYKLIANKYRDSIYRVETAEQVTFF